MPDRWVRRAGAPRYGDDAGSGLRHGVRLARDRAFEVHALDYVLKPFPDERLVAAVDRARETIQERRNGELGRRLAEFVQSWQAGALAPAQESLGAGVAAKPGSRASIDSLDPAIDLEHEAPEPHRPGAASYIGRFAVRSDGRVRFVAAADVDWIEADGNYMVLHVGETRHRLRASLAGLTEGSTRSSSCAFTAR
jgi:two-component system LytT family response regulator